MIRPRPDSQEGRILQLLESADGRKVPLPAILDLRPRISQYSRAIHTLRHKYGFHIENGYEEGRSDHTWFRLVASPDNPSVINPLVDNGGLLFPNSQERHLDLG